MDCYRWSKVSELRSTAEIAPLACSIDERSAWMRRCLTIWLESGAELMDRDMQHQQDLGAARSAVVTSFLRQDRAWWRLVGSWEVK